MRLEDLLISRGEIETHFAYDEIFMGGAIRVPIHPILLSTHIELDRESAYNVFEQSCRDFIDDAKVIAERSKDEDAGKYFSRFVGEPELEEMHPDRHHSLRHLIRLKMKSPLPVFPHADNVYKNGLVISLNTTGHTSLGIEYSQRYTIPYANFPQPKADAYGECIHYTPANTDHPASGLFLKAWAVNYLNDVLRQAYKQIDRIATDELVTDIDERNAPSLLKMLKA